VGPRLASLPKRREDLIEAIQEEKEEGKKMEGLLVDNPLVPSEYIKIIEAAIPKHTLQQLLGLSNKNFVIYALIY